MATMREHYRLGEEIGPVQFWYWPAADFGASYQRAYGRGFREESLKNIQIIDRAVNATFSLFQATDDEFAAIFPGPGQDMELIEDFTERAGEEQALRILSPVWGPPF
jgi:hypothetical protein